MKHIFTSLLLLTPLYFFGQDAHEEQRITSGGVLKPLQAIMDIQHYNIAVDIDTLKKSLDGETTIDLKLSAPTDTLLFDLMRNYTVKKVWLNGKPANFSREADFIYVTPGSKIPAGNAKVRIQYSGVPRVAPSAPHNGGFVWSRDAKGTPWIGVACQFEGGKIYYPCKDHPSDEPNEGADLVVTVPKGLFVTGPGLLQPVKHNGGKSTYHWKTKYPINNYSIVFTAGNFKKAEKMFTTCEGTKVPIVAYVLEEKEQHAMGLVTRLEAYTKILEKYFGEYPWAKEKIGVCQTPYAGMEHQTMNAYGANFGFATSGEEYDGLLFHEYAHEWWGNKVTCDDWADMWIHEGLGTFAQLLHTREREGQEAYNERWRFREWWALGKIPIVQGDTVDIIKAYRADIYGGGATFARILSLAVGDTVFFSTLKKLATDSRYIYQNRMTTRDIEKAFSEAAGQDVTPLFDLLLRGNDKIDISMIMEFPMRAKDKITYKIRLKNLKMKLPIEIITDKGKSKIVLDGENWVSVDAAYPPVIDPNGYYPKRITYGDEYTF